MKMNESYKSPKEWQKSIQEARKDGFKDKDIIKDLAKTVIYFNSNKESDAHLILRLEFKKQIPEKYHKLIE